MVRKEELFQWFGNLSPHKRIDYICGMLRFCVPMELRFIGSVLEDLGKKDFNHLREYETKANSKVELSNFIEASENVFRTKMALYLSLLHSSNRTCSNILYGLLETNLTNVLAVQKASNEFEINNILLVLAMAVNHPAFSFYQKMKLYEFYKQAEETAAAVLDKDDESSDAQETSNGTLCNHLSSPALSPKSAKFASQLHSSKVHIVNIEVKGSVRRSSGDKRNEYKLQVTWSNGEVSEVSKTYQELHDFHNELIRHFSEEASQPKQERKLPFFQGSVTPKDENYHIVAYTRSLLTCPKHIIEWDFLSRFFNENCVKIVSSIGSDTLNSTRSRSISQPNSQQSNSGEDEESVITSYPAKSLTIYNSHLTHSGEPEILSQRCHHGNSKVDVIPRILPAVNCLGQSPVSSPTNSRSESPATQSSESQLLSHQQKPPFQEQFINTTAEEETADKGNVGKLRATMELPPPKDKIFTMPNGVIDPTASSGTINALIPQMQHFPYPPPTYYINPQGVPPFSSYTSYFCSVIPTSPHSGTRDNSPTNSDSYSPIPSPFPHLKTIRKSQVDSSSDDNDRDSLNSKDNSRSVGKGKNVRTQISGQTNLVEIPAVDGQISPLSNSHQFLDKKDGVPVAQLGVPVCGYSSDPGHVQPHLPLVNQYKAQPAHTNLPIHPHSVISMPLENVTVKANSPFLLIGKHHIRDVTMTTTVITSSVNAITSQNTMITTAQCETTGRFMYYYPYCHAPIFSMGNRSTFCTSTAANRLGEAISHSSSKVNVSFPSPGPVIHSQSNKNGPGINSSLQAVHGNSNITNECNLPNQPLSHMDNATRVAVSMQNAQLTYTTSVVTYTSVSSVTPSQSPSVNQSICSACGCTGHNHPVPVSYPYLGAMQAIPPAQFHHYPNIPNTSNGLISTPVPYLPPTHVPNGYSPEVLYNGAHQSHYSIAQPIQTSELGVNSYMYGYNQLQNANQNGGGAATRPKKMSCYNCGSSKHLATECPETTMDAMSGNFHLNYKNDSE